VSLAEIVERLDQISQVWRSDTSAEQRLDRQPPRFGHRTDGTRRDRTNPSRPVRAM